jgi:L-asparagine oxygenase
VRRAIIINHMQSIRDEVHARGFAIRAACAPDLADDALAHEVGVPIALSSGRPVHLLTPAPKEQRPPNSYSGIYGLGAFPLHTDFAHYRVPPRYFMLRCSAPDDGVGTILVDSADVIASVGASLLSRAVVQPRRPRKGVRPLLRLLDPALHLFRWDSEFIRPASAAAAEAFLAVSNALEQQRVTEFRLGQLGDLVVIDNWRMLHGRTAVPPSSHGRRIARVYLESLH